jgi:pilus assembly protein Flp/PilA
MKRLLKQLAQDTTGTSAVEYGMICAMIVLAMLTALKGVANENNGIWGTFSDKTKDAIASGNGAGNGG